MDNICQALSIHSFCSLIFDIDLELMPNSNFGHFGILSVSWSANCDMSTGKAILLWWWCGGVGDGGFSLLYKDFGRMFDNAFPACGFLLFFWVKINLCTLIPLFRPGSVHSGLASWDDFDRVFPDELRVSLFPDKFLHYAWTVL